MHDDPVRCPITECADGNPMEPSDLYDHLHREHEPAELVDRLVELAPDLPYHRDVECQRCGHTGARPGDHPLCRDCETEMGL